MTAWWQNLSIRERTMVTVAGICGALFLFYQFVFTPVHAWHKNVIDKVERAEVGYKQVILAAKVGTATQQQPQNNAVLDTTTPLKNALASSASRARLIVSSTDGNDRRVQITLAAADPEQIYNWLEEVRTQYGAIIVEARLSRARNNKKLVNADRLVFVRQASG